MDGPCARSTMVLSAGEAAGGHARGLLAGPSLQACPHVQHADGGAQMRISEAGASAQAAPTEATHTGGTNGGERAASGIGPATEAPSALLRWPRLRYSQLLMDQLCVIYIAVVQVRAAPVGRGACCPWHRVSAHRLPSKRDRLEAVRQGGPRRKRSTSLPASPPNTAGRQCVAQLGPRGVAGRAGVHAVRAGSQHCGGPGAHCLPRLLQAQQVSAWEGARWWVVGLGVSVGPPEAGFVPATGLGPAPGRPPSTQCTHPFPTRARPRRGWVLPVTRILLFIPPSMRSIGVSARAEQPLNRWHQPACLAMPALLPSACCRLPARLATSEAPSPSHPTPPTPYTPQVGTSLALQKAAVRPGPLGALADFYVVIVSVAAKEGPCRGALRLHPYSLVAGCCSPRWRPPAPCLATTGGDQGCLWVGAQHVTPAASGHPFDQPHSDDSELEHVWILCHAGEECLPARKDGACHRPPASSCAGALGSVGRRRHPRLTHAPLT